jgi:hypothetical protein
MYNKEVEMIKKKIALTLMVFLAALSGCYSNATLTTAPSDSVGGIKKVRNGGLLPSASYVSVDEVISGRDESIRRDEHINSLSEKLYRNLLSTDLFSRIYSSEPNGPHATLNLAVNEKRESGFGTIPKELIGLFTIGLSTAIFPLNDSYVNDY